MIINGFSVFMAIILFTIVSTVCSLFLLHTKSQHIWIIALVLILCLLRCLIPIEINGSLTINIWNIYPEIFSLMSRTVWKSLTVGNLFSLIWLLVTLFLLYKQVCELIRQYRFTKLVIGFPENPHITEIARIAAEAVGCKSSVDVHIVPNFPSPIMTGVFHPIVVLPQSVTDLDALEIEYILRHEISHYTGGDIWYKLVGQLLICLLWWNPAVYLLRRSINHLLELRSDSRACKSLTGDSREQYSTVLLKVAKKSIAARNNNYNAGFIGQFEFKYVRHRISILLSPHTNKKSPLLTTLVACICISLYLVSYSFIIQPAARPPEANDNGYVRITPENAWLIPIEADQYEVWVEGIYFTTIPTEKLTIPPFYELPIYEKSS